MQIDKYQVREYTGTMESLEEIVKYLKLEEHEYNFRVTDKSIYVHPLNCYYFPGDHYSYLLPTEEISAVY